MFLLALLRHDRIFELHGIRRVLSVFSQAASLIDFKIYFAVEAFINYHREHEG